MGPLSWHDDVVNRRNPLLLTADAVAVFVFVIAGRQTHDETNALPQVLVTAAPFVFAMCLAWAVTRVWRDPLSLGRGLAVALTTTVVGSLVRRYGFLEGIANPFIFVTGGFFVATMVGWRWVIGRTLLRSHIPA